jgi:hypothetical protein
MSKFNFHQVIENIDQVKRELPALLANDAQKFFLVSFRNQGYNGEAWAEVKRRMGPGTEGGGEDGTPEWKYPKNKGLTRRTKPIGQGTGILRREVASLAANAIVHYDRFNFRLKLVLDDNMVPYGKYFNEGTEHMPARPFMKDVPELRRILHGRIESYMDKVWQTNK